MSLARKVAMQNSEEFAVSIRILRATILATLVACTQSHTHPPISTSEPAQNSPISAEEESWTPHFTSGTYKYFLQDSSIVAINNDSTNQPVLIQTSMNYNIVVEPSADSFLISGRVDSETTNSRPHTIASSSDSTKKISEFHGVLSREGSIRISAREQATNCSPVSTSLISRIYEIVIPFPRSKLKLGDTWTDTVSTTSCHGRTPIMQQMVRQFTITNFIKWNETKAIQLRRSTTIIFTGSSTETNTHLSATGTGSSNAIIIISQKTGYLLESSSNSNSALTIVTSRGEFPFTQLVSTHIVAK